MNIVNKHLEENQFRNKIYIFNFLLIIGVILIHTNNIDVYHLDNSTEWLAINIYIVEKFFRMWQEVCVPFFFIISGYLFFRTFEWKKIFDKYISRLKSVVIPYFIWCSLYYFYFVGITSIPFIMNLTGIVNGVDLNLQVWGMWLWKDEYYVFWFMKELIIMIILTPVIYLLLKEYGRFSFGFIILPLLCINLSYPILFKCQPFNFYYMLGAFVGINYKNIPLVCERKKTIISIIVICLFCVYFSLLVITDKKVNDSFLDFACMALWYGSDVFTFSHEQKWWIKISFFIYCMHDIVLEVLEKIIYFIFGTRPIFALLDYVLAPSLTIFFCIITAKILKRKCPKVWEILSGGR